MAAPRPRGISDIMPKLQNVSLSSQFLVKFSLPRGDCRTYLRSKGVNNRFIADDVGLLCTDAVLPGSALASVNTTGDFQGFTERFAHTRQFTQISLEFYVDNEYKSLKFLEHWIDFIASGSIADPTSDTYHFKMKYPKEYLDEIKLRLKVSQVVGKTVQLKKRGKEFIGLSPFKNERTPSFTVNDEKEFYHCFSTGEHGNIFDFLMKTKSVGFGEAVKTLAWENTVGRR